MVLDATDCAISEFDGTPGLETRLQRRLVRTAAGLADRPGEAMASADELRVLAALQPARAAPATVHPFVDAVAKLGGWLGRTCDGPPGWAAIWRGTSGWPTWCSVPNGPTPSDRRENHPTPHVVGNRQARASG